MNSAIRTVFRHLLRRMMDGTLPPGTSLPTETALAGEFGTTRMNVFRALEQLKQHGLVVRRKRAGSAVAPQPDPERIRQLYNESSKVVYALLSRNPRGIHWNRTTLTALAQTLRSAGYELRRLPFPAVPSRRDLQTILDRTTDDGAAALVIFPDTGDEPLLRASIPLLLAAKTPIMLLHRSDELNRLDFASSLVIDHFSDGIKVIALRRPDPKPVWCALRTAGLATGLTGVEGDAVPMEEFFIGTSTPDPLFEAIRRDRGRELFFTALNDEYAAEFLLQARAQGLAAGRDYHLAAFDDNPRYRSLGISTMQVPHRRIGEIFGRMICENAWYRQYPLHLSIRVESRFLQRSSCRKLR